MNENSLQFTPLGGEIPNSHTSQQNFLSESSPMEEDQSSLTQTVFPQEGLDNDQTGNSPLPQNSSPTLNVDLVDAADKELKSSLAMDCTNNIQHENLTSQETRSSDIASSINTDENILSGSGGEAHVKSRDKIVENSEERQVGLAHQDSVQEESVLICRLCAVPCQGSTPVFLFRNPPHYPEVCPPKACDESEEEVVGDILSMIKTTLPIKVSCCDKLPKQVCKICVERLQLSHAFLTTVLKAESQLNSLRSLQKSSDVNESKAPCSPSVSYDCPVCRETPVLVSNQKESSSYHGLNSGTYAWGNIRIKDEPEDPIELSREELERSYKDFFGDQKDVRIFRTEERVALKPSKPSCFGGRRPRGRPRSRPFKVTPRGRRGRRALQTTVERILELSETDLENYDCGLRIRSRENSTIAEALTQCLLCERWLPGSAACLQHSLAEHLDCGAFLCPRCPRDDFPGNFELIQHYQESHCPDLELYEVSQTQMSVECTPNSSQEPDLEVDVEPSPNPDLNEQHPEKLKNPSQVPDVVWPMDTVDYDSFQNTPPNELYESQDEMSSNISEVAPRSLTSHSALYEEESNSISTHGSDSNLASEDVSSSHVTDRHVLHDKMIGEVSSLVDDVTFAASPCALGVSDFTNDLQGMGEESQDDSKLAEKTDFCNTQDGNSTNIDTGTVRMNAFKSLQEDNQESQDSLRADELYGFQEAIGDKNQEVNFNGSSISFDTDMSPSTGHDELGEI